MNTTDQLTRQYQEDAAQDRETSNSLAMDRVADLVSATIPKGSKVLDAACAQGKLALKLSALGFVVHACDYVAGNFKADLPFTQVDLNEPFAHKLGTFDCITACAIIEHLENPRHFLRELKKVLRPRGTLILTTPNPDSTVSKALYLAFGHFAWFSDADYDILGHINPVSPRMFEKMADELGYKLKLSSVGDPWEGMKEWPKMRLYAKAVSLLDRGEHKGETLIAVMT